MSKISQIGESYSLRIRLLVQLVVGSLWGRPRKLASCDRGGGISGLKVACSAARDLNGTFSLENRKVSLEGTPKISSQRTKETKRMRASRMRKTGRNIAQPEHVTRAGELKLDTFWRYSMEHLDSAGSDVNIDLLRLLQVDSPSIRCLPHR